MYFLQAAQAPVLVKFGDKLLRVPKYPMSEVVNWATEIMEQRTEQKISGLDEMQAREYLTMYPEVQPNLDEMRRRLRTPEGITRVMTYCLLQAEVINEGTKQPTGEKLDEATVEQILKDNGGGRLAGITWELGDLDDTSAQRDPKAAARDPKLQGGENPLTDSGGSDSRNSSGTGRRTSPSSKPRSPAETL